MSLECRYVRAHRHVAAVLCASFADMQPAAILELRFERARARDAWPSHSYLIADYRLASSSDNRLIRRADCDRFVRQVVKLLKVRITEHKTIVCIPQYESLGDGLDGIKIGRASCREGA